jgi:hypothetical protein
MIWTDIKAALSMGTACSVWLQGCEVPFTGVCAGSNSNVLLLNLRNGSQVTINCSSVAAIETKLADRPHPAA